MLKVSDCLLIFEETFLVGETARYGTVNLHPDVWGMKDEYELIAGTQWKEKTGWWYRWYDSGTNYMTENEYVGAFVTRQDALNDAHNAYGTLDELVDDDDAGWREYAESIGVTLEKYDSPKTNYDQARSIAEEAAFERFGILGEVIYVAAKDDETVEQIASCRNWRVGIAMKESCLGSHIHEEEIFIEI
ncbi:MAG: hypothetical protein LBT05_10205 [Planctomycetaceae bacterium]|nr:hypothetical protein [Planctomycetaceae bacterium]